MVVILGLSAIRTRSASERQLLLDNELGSQLESEFVLKIGLMPAKNNGEGFRETTFVTLSALAYFPIANSLSLVNTPTMYTFLECTPKWRSGSI